jgi:hypothetical protein
MKSTHKAILILGILAVVEVAGFMSIEVINSVFAPDFGETFLDEIFVFLSVATVMFARVAASILLFRIANYRSSWNVWCGIGFFFSALGLAILYSAIAHDIFGLGKEKAA